MTWCSRSAISRAQARNTSTSPPAGSTHVFPWLERDLVQPHAREPLEERRAVVGKVTREPLQRRRTRRRRRVHAAHPRHVLARERDDQVGVVELGLPSPAGCDGSALRGRARRSRRACASSSACLRSRACPTSSPASRARAPAGSRPPSRNGPRSRCRASRREGWARSDIRRGRAGRMRFVTATLVLLRHGQSDWNLKNLFTGWIDVDLTDQGREEARRGGADLARARAAARRRAHVAASARDPYRRSSRSTSARASGSRFGGRGGSTNGTTARCRARTRPRRRPSTAPSK